MDLSWPAPAPLEGAKSRKRPIFKVDKATVDFDDSVTEVLGIALTPESRIGAIGDAGRSIVDMLLRGSGKAHINAGLNCLHIGPHLAGVAANCEQHKTAISDGLRKKPHVVVLDEALSARSETRGSSAWMRVFSEILRSEAFAAFKGAIVVCSCEETFAVRKLCSERWLLNKKCIQQEQITGRGFQIIENAVEAKDSSVEKTNGSRTQRRGGQRGAVADSEAVLEEARELSEFVFEEDLVKTSREKNWKVAFLVEETASGVRTLRGYLCYKHDLISDAEIHVERLAVSPQQRKKGHGRRLMQWLLEEMMRLPTSECARITCSAFDEVVPFYESLGFATADKPEDKEEHAGSDPATWMELRNNSLIESFRACDED